MADPLLDKDALDEALRLVTEEATRYLAQLDAAPVRPPGAEPGGPVGAPLPLDGDGSLAAVRELIEAASEGATRSAGPRFFHFVMGGGTPAALAADWWTSAIDQIAFNWVSSPFAMRIEQVAVAWLQELFGLPAALERRLHERRDVRELHRARGRAPVVGAAAGRGRGGGGPVGPAARAGVRQRLRARERDEGARDAGRRAPAGADVPGRRERPARRRGARRRAARSRTVRRRSSSRPRAR